VSAPTHQLKNKLINYPPARAEVAAVWAPHTTLHEINSPEVYTPWALAANRMHNQLCHSQEQLFPEGHRLQRTPDFTQTLVTLQFVQDRQKKQTPSFLLKHSIRSLHSLNQVFQTAQKN
jgi:hypothetical protein